jgi:hypothetical protein
MALCAVSAGLLAALCWLCAAGRFRTLPALLATLYLFAAFFLMLLVGRHSLFIYSSPPLLSYRYTIFPASMLGLAMVATLDGVPRGAARWIAIAAWVLGLGWAWHSRFVIPPFRDYDWPRWSRVLELKLATGSRAPLRIPMNPPWAPLEFDRVDFATDAQVPPAAVLTGLGTRGTFRQQFVVRCDGLAGVGMRLAVAAPSTQGMLRMRLLDESGHVVAGHESPRAEVLLDGPWQSLWFDPIAGSAMQRYTIVLEAVNNTAETTVLVLGTLGDPYPDGQAFMGAAAFDGDASFRYACAPP